MPKKILTSGCLTSDHKSYSKLQRFTKAIPLTLFSNTESYRKAMKRNDIMG